MKPIAILLLLCAALHAAPMQVRVATFNASLNRTALGQLASDLNVTTNNQAKRVAEIIQRVAPDILLINEFDYDSSNPTLALTRFHNNYLAIPQQTGLPALNYPYRYVAPSNTGIPSGFDLDNNGTIGTTVGTQAYGDDSFGFGEFPGKYSFAVYSKYPIQMAAIRTFQLFKWQDMPGHVAPPGFYSAPELAVFRLSSKNHVDLPIELKPGHILHLLASHPTPPAFDSGEDRNGRRNHDEIRLWADYISNATYLRDDTGVSGGLAGEQRFVILGDMNADPLDGDSYLAAINQLRNHALINSTPNPSSAGGAQQGPAQGGINNSHTGNPAYDTSDFSEGSAGNLRVDHVLPSKRGFSVVSSGVFWPPSTDPLYSVLFQSASQTQGNQTTDHRLVWMDLTVTPILSQAVRNFVDSQQGADIVLTWGTQEGVSYKVEYTTDFASWTDIPAIPISLNIATQTATATDAGAASGGKKFYRVVATVDAPAGAAPSGIAKRIPPVNVSK